MADKRKYVDNLEVGTLVAYGFPNKGMQSGKVTEIFEEEVLVEDFDGDIYPINKAEILWVKTGQRWPKEIFKALRGE